MLSGLSDIYTLDEVQKILLKLSGEALMGDNSLGLITDLLNTKEIKTIVDKGVESQLYWCGNIFRAFKRRK